MRGVADAVFDDDLAGAAAEKLADTGDVEGERCCVQRHGEKVSQRDQHPPLCTMHSAMQRTEAAVAIAMTLSLAPMPLPRARRWMTTR